MERFSRICESFFFFFIRETRIILIGYYANWHLKIENLAFIVVYFIIFNDDESGLGEMNVLFTFLENCICRIIKISFFCLFAQFISAEY